MQFGIMFANAVFGRPRDAAGGGPDVETVKRLGDLGVSRLVLPPLGFDLDSLDTQLERFADEAIATVG